MASSSLYHQQNAFSGIEPPSQRRNVEESSRLFDVFINHRGPDVRYTLATQLYNSLEGLGIRTFLGNSPKSHELGNSFPSTIETAIRSAKVHIAIFSEGYAESPWCLDELLLMLQSKAKIIPVFYQVQAWELRYIDRGVYAGAFCKYKEKGRHLNKIEEWKEALQQVAYTAGYEFKNSDFSDCKDIVSAVEKEVERCKRLHVAKYPVGLHKLVRHFERQCLDELVQDFERQCGMKKAAKEKANVVGIFGMGGVGKTTLSKELFNRWRSAYTRASFLFDVREASATGQLHSLQSKLVKDLFYEDHSFLSSEEGTSSLRDRLERSGSSSFLVVLDDIDHVQQLDALLVMDLLNKPGKNLVIITTRDVGVLVRGGIDNSYHLKRLDREDGTELFCWHAFRQPCPCSGYEDLVQAFVNSCGGLPLSLQVLGRHVCGRTRRSWQDQLNKLSKTLHGDIKKRLKISFDSLDYEERQIFMDIACFFIDISITKAMTIWKGSRWSAHQALETLKEKCLVEEVEIRHLNRIEWKCEYSSEGSVLRMHDHLRDLGREMANELSHPPRVWHPQYLKSLESRGFQYILAQVKGRCFHSILDESMGCGVTYFLGEPEDSSDTSLLWLQLEYLDWPQLNPNSDMNSIIPSWIPLQNLQCLIISNGCFQKLWHRDVQPPLQLRELKITQCSDVQRFPIYIGHLQHLKKIILDFGFRGGSLPEELCDLESLEHLELSCCPMLSSLPHRFGDLRTLRYVDLSNCGQLEELPHSFEQLICLEYLRLSSCPMLSSLPHRFGDLRNLRYIDLSNCGQLEELPQSFEKLTSLKYLRLSCCYKLKLRLDMLKNMTTLEYLDLTSCHELEELPHQITNQASLTRLFVEGTSMRDLPTNIDELGNLEELRIGSPMLTSLPSSLGNLSCLSCLLIDGCPQLEYLPQSVCLLDLLKQVRIRSSGIREMPFGAGSSNFEVTGKQASNSASNLRPSIIEHGSLQNKLPASLETLSLVANPQLMEIRILPQSLSILQICVCKVLKNMSGIGGLVNLRRLEICSCPELDELPSFADLASLQDFKIQGCPKVERIQGLEHCTSLQILTAEVPLIDSLENVEELRRVDLKSYNISALKPCILSIKKCPWEMMIRGRVIHTVKPIVESLSSANLTVLLLEKDSDWDNVTQDLFNAAFLWYEEEKESNNEESGSRGVKVVQIAVCRERSSAFPEYCVGRRFGSNPNVKQRKVMLATGNRERVVAAFHDLFALME